MNLKPFSFCTKAYVFMLCVSFKPNYFDNFILDSNMCLVKNKS